MALIKVTDWIRQTFEKDSAPDARTIKKMIRDKQIPGAFIGSTAYVDHEAWQRQNYKQIDKREAAGLPNGYKLNQ